MTSTGWVLIAVLANFFLLCIAAVGFRFRAPLKRRWARRCHFKKTQRLIEEAMADETKLPRSNLDIFISFIPPGDVLMEDGAMLASALVTFQEQLLAGDLLSPKLRDMFHWIFHKTCEFFTAYLNAMMAKSDMLLAMEERATLGEGQSRRIYDPVRLEKIVTEPAFEPFMQLVQGDFKAAVEAPWPASFAREQQEALSEKRQPARGAADEVLQALHDGSATRVRVSAFLEKVVSRAVNRVKPVPGKGNKDTGSIVATAGVPKGVLRIVEKLAFEPEPAKHKDVRYLCDLARGEIKADSMESLQRVLEEILEMHKNGTICLVQFKNRFENPIVGGWADILINAVFQRDPKLHIFEIQLVHQKLSVMRKQVGGHSDYKTTRAASEILRLIQEQHPTIMAESETRRSAAALVMPNAMATLRAPLGAAQRQRPQSFNSASSSMSVQTFEPSSQAANSAASEDAQAQGACQPEEAFTTLSI